MSDVGAPGPLGSPEDEGDLDPSYTSSYEPTGARTEDADDGDAGDLVSDPVTGSTPADAAEEGTGLPPAGSDPMGGGGAPSG